MEIGDASDLICVAAEKLHADMLVMSSHGYDLIKRVFFYTEQCRDESKMKQACISRH